MEEKRKIGFVINPISGTRSKENIPELIEKLIDSALYDVTVKLTARAGHATELAKEMVAEKFYIVVAVGGDGTVNEVAQSLVHTNCALGIIPCGSGNGLARHLGIPLDIKSAVCLINNTRIAAIDYGTANDIKFFCTCGVGFDAHVGHQFAQSKTRGFFTYIKKIFGEFMKYKAKKYKLKTKNDTIKKRAFLVTFANAAQYGNNAFIAPHADIQDGLIDVCILEPFPAYQVIDIGLKLIRKKITKSQYIQILKVNEVTIKRRKRDVFHFDGEPCIMKKKITIKSHKQGLKVAVAFNSALKQPDYYK